MSFLSEILGSGDAKAPEIILNETGPKAYAASALEQACTHAWQQAQDRKSKAMLVYVHGRAAGLGQDREPHESFIKDRVIDEFEQDHKATVVMLHWPHHALGTSFPRDAAAAAAPLLVATLEQLAATRPEALGHIPTVLVTHSMGGIVLSEAAALKASAFDQVKTVITSASAASLQGSVQWLGALKHSKVFVTRNEHDGALKVVDKHGSMLGLGDGAALKAAGTVADVFYLMVTNQNVGHPYFYAQEEASGGRAILRDHFFSRLYQGGELDLSKYEKVLGDSAIYRMKGIYAYASAADIREQACASGSLSGMNNAC